jgi:hypothetical protein
MKKRERGMVRALRHPLRPTQGQAGLMEEPTEALVCPPPLAFDHPERARAGGCRDHGAVDHGHPRLLPPEAVPTTR